LHLDAVEAGDERIPGRLCILRDNALDLGDVEHAQGRDRLEALRGEGLAVWPNR
jgi:hypothetical protein